MIHIFFIRSAFHCYPFSVIIVSLCTFFLFLVRFEYNNLKSSSRHGFYFLKIGHQEIFQVEIHFYLISIEAEVVFSLYFH